MNSFDDKIRIAQDRIRLAYEALQFRAPGEKLYVAYSGGKDSECIAQLAIDAIGKDSTEINYSCTGIDPPELVWHVKAKFKTWRAQGIECHYNMPKESMMSLIIRKGPPTRLSRYCCGFLKEGGGDGRCVITGVRWEESERRADGHGIMTVMSKNHAKREKYNNDNDISRRIQEICSTKRRYTINPIVDWTFHDVWAYIRKNGIDYCSLYDEGFKRLGCVGCPMPTSKGRYHEFARWPKMKRYYMNAFTKFLQRNPRKGKYAQAYGWKTAEDIFHWWMEDGVLPGQEEWDMEALFERE